MSAAVSALYIGVCLIFVLALVLPENAMVEKEDDDADPPPTFPLF